MPQIDTGVGRQGQPVPEVWVTLTQSEARELLDALMSWAEEREGYTTPGWHMHLTDEAGNELTVAIATEDSPVPRE